MKDKSTTTCTKKNSSCVKKSRDAEIERWDNWKKQHPNLPERT
jgi:hypothetical protein